MKCARCGSESMHVIRFAPGKVLEFYRCHSCYYESKANTFSFPVKPLQRKCNTTYRKRK